MVAHGIARVRFELFVRDRERSIRFYEHALGFTRERKNRWNSSRYTQIVNGSACIGLCPLASLPANHYFRAATSDRLGVGTEIVFEVDDLPAYARRAQLVDAIFEPIARRPWGLRDFRVIDPDGYYIRVTESDEESTEPRT